MFFLPSKENIVLMTLLTVTAGVGDFMVGHAEFKIYAAVFDNLTHAVIGGLSWFIVCFNCKRYSSNVLLEVFLCSLIASLIDVDHFIAARSFSLKDATSLPHRPILHCSTFPLILVITLSALAFLVRSKFVLVSAMIVFTSVGSHHTRDATRRGYWLGPFGSTPPIPYYSYILITDIIPYTVIYILNSVHFDRRLPSFDYIKA